MIPKFYKHIDLSNLPKNNNKIQWTKSVGCSIPFQYRDICGELIITGYKHSIVTLKFNDTEFEIRVPHLIQLKIGKYIGVIIKDYRYAIGEQINGVVITARKKDKDKYNNIKYYQYKCTKCGYDCTEYFKGGVKYDELWIREGSLTIGCGCSCCAHEITVCGINDIPTLERWMVAYFINGESEAKKYSPASNKKSNFECPFCHEQKFDYSINTLFYNHGIGCRCSDGISYPEKFIGELLRQTGTIFIRQVSKNTKWFVENDVKYRYDFGIPSKNMIIETHGMQHYENSGGAFSMTVKQIQLNDKCKREYATNHGIDIYIELDCRYSNIDYIKQSVMNSALPNILEFTINDIDWELCNTRAINSMIIEVSDFKNEHPLLNSTEIADSFCLSKSTVEKYLRQAKSIGLSTSYEAYKSQSRLLHCQQNPIVVLTLDDNYVVTFNGVTDLINKSCDMLGCQMTIHGIYDALSKKTKSHRNYKLMRYVDYVQLQKEEKN